MHGLIGHGVKLSELIRALKLEIAQSGDVMRVGEFACRLKDETAPAYEAGLIRLLPKLGIEHGLILDKRARGYLHWALLGGNRDLVLAILGALRKVGDGRAIRNVA